MGTQAIKCKCCGGVIPNLKRGDTLYCKSCKDCHDKLYAKWKTKLKRDFDKLDEIYSKIKRQKEEIRELLKETLEEWDMKIKYKPPSVTKYLNR